MNIKILVATHKQYWMPEDSVYMPIHVGREGKADIGYTGDHTGDNIEIADRGDDRLQESDRDEQQPTAHIALAWRVHADLLIAVHFNGIWII